MVLVIIWETQISAEDGKPENPIKNPLWYGREQHIKKLNSPKINAAVNN